MDEAEKDELLKRKILDEAEKEGCVAASAFDGDQNHKKRKNAMRARILEGIILENRLRYCRFSERKSKIETAEYFAVFGSPERTREIIGAERDSFRALNFRGDVQTLLDGKIFYHPATDKELADFDKRNELHLDEKDLDLLPHFVGGWEYDSKSRIYRSGRYLCSLRPPSVENPEYVASIGMLAPIGVTVKKITAKTLEDALDGMKKWRI